MDDLKEGLTWSAVGDCHLRCRVNVHDLFARADSAIVCSAEGASALITSSLLLYTLIDPSLLLLLL